MEVATTKIVAKVEETEASKEEKDAKAEKLALKKAEKKAKRDAAKANKAATENKVTDDGKAVVKKVEESKAA